jgi:dGTPase
MTKKYFHAWDQKLNPQRFRISKARDVPKGWNPFDSDYNRIAMSAPFRRLQDKAQVFPLEPNDFVRTRLTHSIETSSIARSMGVRFENWLLGKEYINNDRIGHIPSILAAAGLAHDIGNPPFGHFGEQCFRDFFSSNMHLTEDLNEKEIADLLNFDGNVQGFRTLLRLGLATDEFSYNLTFPTLATVVKYPFNSIDGNKKDEKNISLKKYGFYQTDESLYKYIDEALSLSNRRHPLCFLLEAADDISYSVSDIEDGFKKGTINIEFILETLSDKYLDDKECAELYCKIIVLNKELKNRENKLALIAQESRIFAQTKMINSAVQKFQNYHDDIVNGKYDRELLSDTPSENLRKFFGDIAIQNFNHESVIKSELVGQRVISFLLGKFTGAVLSEDFRNTKSFKGKFYSLLSHQSRYAKEKTNYSNDKFLKLLMVIDHVAGMTDTYALTVYQELCGFK